MSVHINTFEVENVKRVRSLTLTPARTGLTVIGGRNAQGKTSVLDAIAWALGGDRHRPSNPRREGANTDPRLKLTLSNGLIVERSGKNGALKVTDPSGKRHGQQLLNSFTEELALNLPKFLEASDKEKAETLLRIIGIGDRLAELDRKCSELYNQRLYVGREADAKARYAQQLPEVPDAPEQEVSALELIQRQQDILYQNEENRKKRLRLSQLRQEYDSVQEQIDLLTDRLRTLQEDLNTAETAAADLQDQSTAQLEENIRRVEQINQAVRTNAEKRRAAREAQALQERYTRLSAEIEGVRNQRQALLDGADLPLPGLTVEEGKLLYKGQPWDGMAGAEQLQVATAIVRRLNPECGFVLLDKLEQMDLETLRTFGDWLEQEGLQAIATRVSSGGECSIIIEDGLAKAQTAPVQWKEGVF